MLKLNVRDENKGGDVYVNPREVVFVQQEPHSPTRVKLTDGTIFEVTDPIASLVSRISHAMHVYGERVTVQKEDDAKS